MSTDEQRTYMKYESTPGLEQAAGQGGRMPPWSRCKGARIGLWPPTFQWLHSLWS